MFSGILGFVSDICKLAGGQDGVRVLAKIIESFQFFGF